MDEHGSQRREALALGRVALAAASWGFVPLLVRAVHTSSLVIAFWRVALAGLAFFILFLVRGRLGDIGRLGRRTFAGLGLLGALLAAGWLLFFSAINLAPVAVAVLLTFTSPLFLAILSPMFTGDPFDRRIVLPLLVAFAGILLIAAPKGIGGVDGALSGSRTLGAVLALGSAVVLAMSTVAQKRILRSLPPELVMFAQTVAAALLLLPFAVTMPGPTAGTEWAALAVLGFGLTTVPFLLFLSGLRRVRADRVGVVTYVEPVSAVLLAAVFLHEPLTLTTALGGAAVVAGGFLVARMSPMTVPEAPAVDLSQG